MARKDKFYIRVCPFYDKTDKRSLINGEKEILCEIATYFDGMLETIDQGQFVEYRFLFKSQGRALKFVTNAMPEMLPYTIFSFEHEMDFGCQFCGEYGWGPMLKDELWNLIAKNKKGFICFPCMEGKT